MEQILLNSFMPTRIISGEKCVTASLSVWKTAGKHCLIVTGAKGAKASGALDDVLSALTQCGISYTIFDRICENPSVRDCEEAGRLAASEKADFIVGIGGGSALDAAKAVAIFAKNESLDSLSIYKREIPSEKLGLYLVGTTAGTGSEVTGVSVLTDVNGMKKSISGADCYADVSFCDARYTVSSSYDVTVSTALDAYAHALESFLSCTANDLSEMYSCKALTLLRKNLLLLKEQGASAITLQCRNELYAASLYAGLAINITGTAFPHTVGYILTEEFNVPHGKACTAFHPVLLERAEKYRPERIGTVCDVLHCTVAQLNEMTRSLTDVNVQFTRSEAEKLCARWTGTVKNFERTPGGFTPANAVEALLSL